MMKQMLLMALVVGPCVGDGASDRTASSEDLTPEEAPVGDVVPVVPVPVPVPGGGSATQNPTRGPVAGIQTTSVLLFEGSIDQYTDAYVNEQVIPTVRTASGLRPDEVAIQLASVRPGSVQITLLYIALLQGVSLAQLQAAAQAVVAQALNPNSPLRAALPLLSGALPLILYTHSPVESGDKLSDGAVAGIVIASIVVGVGLLVAVYCVIKNQAQSPPEQAAEPYGGEEGDELPEKQKEEEV